MRWLGERKDAPAADDARHDELCVQIFSHIGEVVNFENCSEWRLVSAHFESTYGSQGRTVAFFRRRRRG